MNLLLCKLWEALHVEVKTVFLHSDIALDLCVCPV